MITGAILIIVGALFLKMGGQIISDDSLVTLIGWVIICVGAVNILPTLFWVAVIVGAILAIKHFKVLDAIKDAFK